MLRRLPPVNDLVSRFSQAVTIIHRIVSFPDALRLSLYFPFGED